MQFHADRRSPAAGERRRQRKLGSEAIFVVLGVEEDTVEVAVESVPGLRPGSVLRLTTDAVRSMEPLPGRPVSPDPSAAQLG